MGIISVSIFSGCSATKPKPFSINIKDNNDSRQIGVYSMNAFKEKDWDINKAVYLLEAAKELHADGYEYFTLHPTQGIPYSITNFKDMKDYCRPDLNDDQSWGSLEVKCRIGGVGVVGVKERSSTVPTWKTQDVIDDKVINEAYNKWLAEFDIKTVERIIKYIDSEKK